MGKGERTDYMSIAPNGARLELVTPSRSFDRIQCSPPSISNPLVPLCALDFWVLGTCDEINDLTDEEAIISLTTTLGIIASQKPLSIYGLRFP